MKRWTCTLVIALFNPGMHAQTSPFLDTTFGNARFLSTPINPWITSAYHAIPRQLHQHGLVIFCDFRNLPVTPPLSTSELNLKTIWQVSKFYSSNSRRKQLTIGANDPARIMANTHHRILAFLNQTMQEHSLEIQLPISKKTTVSTGLGLIHTNPYEFKNHSAILGKIQWQNELSSTLRIFTQLQGIFTHPSPGESPFVSPVYPSTTALTSPLDYISTLSLTEPSSALNYYYPHQRLMWNIESAIAIHGNSIKVPVFAVAKTGNSQPSIGLTAWIPLNHKSMEHLEIGIRSGQNPIFISISGRIPSKTPTASTTLYWRFGMSWNQHLPILPKLSLLIVP